MAAVVVRVVQGLRGGARAGSWWQCEAVLVVTVVHHHLPISFLTMDDYSLQIDFDMCMNLQSAFLTSHCNAASGE